MTIKLENIDLSKPEDRKAFEELVGLVVKQEAKTMFTEFEGTPCLSNKILFGLYDGTILEKERYNALGHLVKCKMCSDDLKTYINLKESKKGKESS